MIPDESDIIIQHVQLAPGGSAVDLYGYYLGLYIASNSNETDTVTVNRYI